MRSSRESFLKYITRLLLTHSMYRFAHTYSGPNMDIITPPTLKPGEKIHYCICHDETCIHAGDQCKCIWQREGEQPLRDKSRGRISHCSDFIIEHCGRLVLSAEEITKQMALPEEPLPPSTVAPDTMSPPSLPNPQEPVITNVNGSKAKTKPKKPRKTKKSKAKDTPPEPTAGRRTLVRPDGWVPPPPPAPFTSYRIPSFDARRIIYPGKNYDPWWDMPQLIAQVWHLFPMDLLI